MRKLLLLLFFAALKVSAQDILTFRNGDVQNVKILEISPTEVKYKMFNNLDGPIFVERRSRLFSVKYENGEVQKLNDLQKTDGGYYSDYYSSELATQIVYTKQIDLYIQDAWGVGLLFRKEINPYVGWNILGVSFMSGWCNPKDAGIVNVRMFGVRLYTPSFSTLRFYAELNPGYTHVYADTGTSFFGCLKAHCFGLDFSTGLQLNKHVAFGYNLNYMVNKNGHEISHWGRISFMF